MTGIVAPTSVLEQRIPAPVRVVLSCVGAFIPAFVINDLGGTFWPFNIGTPITMSIVLGALGVGGVFVFAGLFGTGARWTLEPHALRIDLEAGRFSRRTRLTREDVRALYVEAPEHDTAAARAYVCLTDRRDRVWRSPGFATLDSAHAYAAGLGAHLRVPVTSPP